MKDKAEVTIIISSCDADIDTCYPFFYLLKKYWKSRPSSWNIVLNTETLSYQDDELNIICPRVDLKKRSSSWTTRLNKVLSDINTEFVLLILSDYFFMDNVNQEKLNKCVKWMDANKEIGVFYFDPNPYCKKEEAIYDGFEKGKNGESFLANAQIGLWRKSVLMDLTKYKEDPWQWEQLASERTYYMDEEFYFLKEDEEKVFFYDWTATGCAVCARKWTKGCIELFEKNGIECDFSKRGIWDEAENHPRTQIPFLKHLFRPPLGKRVINKISKRCGNKSRKKE